MVNLYKTTRSQDGLKTEQDNNATDIKSLGDRTTDATGYVILSQDEHIFLPDTYNDRVGIINEIVDVTNKIGEVLDTMKNISAMDSLGKPIVFTPTWVTSIDNVKSSLDDIINSLNDLKDRLQ